LPTAAKTETKIAATADKTAKNQIISLKSKNSPDNEFC